MARKQVRSGGVDAPIPSAVPLREGAAVTSMKEFRLGDVAGLLQRQAELHLYPPPPPLLLLLLSP